MNSRKPSTDRSPVSSQQWMITFDEGQAAKVKKKHHTKVRDLETVKEGHKEGHGGKKEKKEKKRKHKREKHRQKEREEGTKLPGPSPIRDASWPSPAYIDHNPKAKPLNSFDAAGPSTEQPPRQDQKDFAPLKRDHYTENRRYDQPLQGRH